MSYDGNEEFLAWKEELETKKQDILKRREIIQNKLHKYKLRLDIATSLDADLRSSIYEDLEKKVQGLEQELDNFNVANEAELNEIEALLTKLERKLL